MNGYDVSFRFSMFDSNMSPARNLNYAVKLATDACWLSVLHGFTM
jgi:hypothetical protein